MIKSRVYADSYELLIAWMDANKKVEKLNKRVRIPLFRADIDFINNKLIIGDYFSLVKKNRSFNVYQYAKDYLSTKERVS